MSPPDHSEPRGEAAELAALLTDTVPGRPLAGPLIAFGSLPSTQEHCRALAAAGASEGLIVVADHQTAGRGQRGRRWEDQPGTAILMSCLLRPTRSPARWGELPLVAGCAVAEAIEAATGAPTRLRWPNDVLVQGYKVAGILAEGTVGPAPYVVLGIGVNVERGPHPWPDGLATRAASLAEIGHSVERPVLLRAVLGRLAARYDQWQQAGFTAAQSEWRRRALLGERVQVGVESGVGVDLAPSGGLVIRRDDGSTVTVVAAGGA